MTKKKLMEKLLTPKEKANGVAPYGSKNWENRKKGIEKKVKDRADQAHARAVIRKQNAVKKPPTKKEVKAAKEIVRKVMKRSERHYKFNNKNK